MSKHLEKGRLGEQIAVDYLERRGYHILETNYRHKRMEIDIIAVHDGVVLFIEVKARSSYQYGYPESAVDEHKIEMILACADYYIDQIGWNGEIRFDIIAILLGDPPKIEHLKDAF
ncbi:YraN family protein [Fulvivirgaceae bacterium BMA12]|uniref:UPF0102 protein QQ020_28360 n=1 Tax=Agaribacillus aureus TaxID=3051825 RepID=A0ABT8LE25_9BACT|nr:YraN family protein [Fulvivirgaceae bacterium BMA12]